MPTRFAWRDPTGTETVLSDPASGYRDSRGRITAVADWTGLGAPGYSFAEYPVPGLAGTRLQATVVGARDMALKTSFVVDSPDGVGPLVNEWITRLASGPGTLVVYRAAGVRSIGCAYAGGLDSPTRTSPTSYQATFGLHAFDPYFVGAPAVPLTFAVASVGTFGPLLPLKIASSVVQSQQSALNVGDVAAYGVWTVTGPGGPLTLAAGGSTLTWNGTLTAGQSLTIDTSPAAQSVTDSTGTDRYYQLDPTSRLWPLQPGNNNLTITLTGATTDSLVTLNYSPRYLSAL